MTSKVDGKYLVGSPDDRARYTDDEYAEYIQTAHLIFAKFVQSRHHFQYKKILAVAGYLVIHMSDKE